MRILVIDDEYVALSKMVLMLQAYGKTEAATHSKQAYEKFMSAVVERKYYDLITVDVNMPGINGLELVRMFNEKEQELTKAGWDIKKSCKIIVTAESEKETVLKAIRANCDGFIVKPVRKHVLVQKLKKLGFILS